MNALDPKIALNLVRQLSVMRDYPRLPDGESRMAEVLSECTVSVGHARAVIAAFDQQFPSIRELRDTADGLRPKFTPAEPDLREKWLAEGAIYDPEWSAKIAQELVESSETAHQRRAREWKAVLAAYRTAHESRRLIPVLRLATLITDRDVARIRKQLGFELTPWDRQNLEAGS